MKSFIALVSWTSDNRMTGDTGLGKFENFDTRAEAESHVAKYGGFVVEKPSDETDDWLINPVNKTVSIDVLPPDPGPTHDEIYDQVMKNQKVFKAFALCINDGSIVPGANVSNAALKAAVKAKM